MNLFRLTRFTGALAALVVISVASCKKVNEATELGSDLIPAVDNVTTFDTVLAVQSFNYPFTTEDSSVSSPLGSNFIGTIGNDPLFGTTQATLFLQLKPQVYKNPFAFADKSKIVGLDSIVMVLGYSATYGDSVTPQQFRVYEMDQSNVFRSDSNYAIRENNFTFNNPISATQQVLPYTLNDSIKLFREASANQVRLKLDNAFGDRLLQYDSTAAYQNDSIFSTYVKGFAVVPEGGLGNGLIGTNLSDTNTKLAIYYRYTNSAGALDTAVTYFRFNVSTNRSASANYINRDRSASEFATVAGDDAADQLVYLQNTPGTYANITVPNLGTVTNRVIHRAELIVEQVPDALSKTLTPPAFLYLDAYDSANKVYRTIPDDVTFNSQNGEIASALSGGVPVLEKDAFGNNIYVWKFVLTRYLQKVVNKNLPVYGFRLLAPYITYTYFGTSSTQRTWSINSNYAVGRVRVGGGNHPTQPMKLRIIYSRL